MIKKLSFLGMLLTVGFSLFWLAAYAAIGWRPPVYSETALQALMVGLWIIFWTVFCFTPTGRGKS